MRAAELRGLPGPPTGPVLGVQLVTEGWVARAPVRLRQQYLDAQNVSEAWVRQQGVVRG